MGYNTCPMTVPDSQPESEPDRVPDEVMPIKDNTGASETHACCSKCPGKAFCSPVSGSCYDSKAKSYYKSCATEKIVTDKPDMPACCEKCQGKGFCSPKSLRCYNNETRLLRVLCLNRCRAEVFGQRSSVRPSRIGYIDKVYYRENCLAYKQLDAF